MSEHTKEPWRTDAPSGFPGDVMAGKEMIARTTITDQSNAKANASRIVACANACEGVPTEQLEWDVSMFLDMMKERNTLEQQRDELLVALEATVEAIRLFRNEPQLKRLVSLRATAGYVAMDAAMDRGTAAIAKVKP